MSELLNAADAPNAKPGAVAELRRFLAAHPHLTEKAEGIAGVVEEAILSKMTLERPGAAEVLRAELKGIRNSLDYEDAPELERLIIAEIVISWLTVQLIEAHIAQGREPGMVEFYERRLSHTQKRFLRASESLARVRKLTERRMSPAALAYLKGMAQR